MKVISNAEASADEIKDLVIARLATREIESFNILYSQTFSDFENLTNLTDPLLEVDTHGKLVACLADEWGTEDNGLNWKFHIRDGVKWVDMNANEKADVTSLCTDCRRKFQVPGDGRHQDTGCKHHRVHLQR